MSKALLICLRDPARTAEFADKLRRLNARILPDNIAPNPPVVTAYEGVVTAVYNPVSLVRREGASVCLGTMLSPADDWHLPGAAIPDGNYALYRANAQTVELVTDILASRTVWYAHTDEMFIASSSQRAIVALLGDFRFNQAVIPWMLSAGTLGYGNSWDRRIGWLKGDSRLVLDRQAWRLRVTTAPVAFSVFPASEHEHRERIKAVIQAVFDQLQLDSSKWVMTLSGGADSRGVLLFLKTRIPCVTYGFEDALEDPESDGYIARQVAGRFGAPFRYFPTDVPSALTMDTLIGRFLAAGEGRVDHIPGYMNGYSHWKVLFEEGIEGIVRGDQSFGLPPLELYRRYFSYVTDYDDRRSVNLHLLSDFTNLPDYRTLDLPEQALHDDLLRRDGESSADWKHRLYQIFRAPLVLSSMNDLKAGHVETLNPFVIHSIIRQVRTLPVALRQNKRILYEINAEFGLNLAYSTRRAQGSRAIVLRQPAALQFLREELRSSAVQELFSERLIHFLDNHVKPLSAPKRSPLYNRLKRQLLQRLPERIVSLAYNQRREIDYNTLALRVSIVSRMAQMLRADAASLKD